MRAVLETRSLRKLGQAEWNDSGKLTVGQFDSSTRLELLRQSNEIRALRPRGGASAERKFGAAWLLVSCGVRHDGSREIGTPVRRLLRHGELAHNRPMNTSRGREHNEADSLSPILFATPRARRDRRPVQLGSADPENRERSAT